jgi:hypothetical protein
LKKAKKNQLYPFPVYMIFKKSGIQYSFLKPPAGAGVPPVSPTSPLQVRTSVLELSFIIAAKLYKYDPAALEEKV